MCFQRLGERIEKKDGVKAVNEVFNYSKETKNNLR